MTGGGASFALAGRIVVVTGCLGQLGRHFCATLLEHGARVAGLDLAPAEAAGGRLAEWQRSGDFTYVQADVTDRASLEAARGAIAAAFADDAYGLVNNAGLDAPPGADARQNGPFEDYPLDAWRRVFDVNATGPFLCCQVFGAPMAARGRGSIVNIGSIYGVLAPDQGLYEYRRARGEPFYKPVAYSASKSSLYNLTRYLAVYWGPRQVRVNTLTFAGVFNGQEPAFLERYQAKVPLGRMADPADYGGAVVFLMSDASRYMTGSNMVIDGGFTAM